MRVLHLDHTRSVGGAELALARIVRTAVSWTPVISVPPDHGSPAGRSAFQGEPSLVVVGVAQRAGATDDRATASQKLSFVCRLALQAITLRLSRSYRSADVVHCNTSRSGIYGTVAGALFGRAKTVIHVRDVVSPESLGRLGHLAFTRFALPRADGVIANSQASLASASPHMRAGRPSVVIPSPIGISVPELARRNLRPRVLKIGMLARIDPWKGQDLLIRAFARALRGEDVRLLLAGAPLFEKDAYLDSLRATAEECGVTAKVDFLGQVDDVPSFLDEIDVGVQSSIRPEPLGQNVLQYLAAGLPTIATDRGGPTEWIDHGRNGLLFRMGNEGALAKALSEVFSDPSLRASLSEGASNTAGILTDAQSSALHGDFFRRVLENA